jgi:ATP-binding cassette subfamily A (ABC1) protein 3
MPPSGARLALDDLSLECREGQVTVLLGHNGEDQAAHSGIESGPEAASAGDGRGGGSSVNDDVEGVQAMVGYCPQHDTCFDQLTVREHLLLFGGIKRVAAGALAARVDELIADVGLAEKADAFAATLSAACRGCSF